MEWKRYKATKFQNCDYFFQKLIKVIGEEKIFAEIEVFNFKDRKGHQLTIQIPEEVSITGMTINITEFSYPELDLKKIEKNAIKIINSLTKKNDD